MMMRYWFGVVLVMFVSALVLSLSGVPRPAGLTILVLIFAIAFGTKEIVERWESSLGYEEEEIQK